MGVKEKCAAFLKARYQHSNYQQFFIIFLKEKFARPQLNHSVRISRKIKCRRGSREEEEEEKEKEEEEEAAFYIPSYIMCSFLEMLMNF